MVLLLIDPLIMQQESAPAIFKIAISLMFIDIINKKWHPLPAFG